MKAEKKKHVFWMKFLIFFLLQFFFFFFLELNQNALRYKYDLLRKYEKLEITQKIHNDMKNIDFNILYNASKVQNNNNNNKKNTNLKIAVHYILYELHFGRITFCAFSV